MITKYLKQDITTTSLNYIAHGVNCQNVMGSGVARALFMNWPKVKSEYHEYCKVFDENHMGECSLLGRISPVMLPNESLVIFNCFTQRFFGNDGRKYVDYVSIRNAFLQLSFDIKGNKIAIPKIGCGLAGGDWNIVSQIINEATADRLEVWVYEQ